MRRINFFLTSKEVGVLFYFIFFNGQVPVWIGLNLTFAFVLRFLFFLFFLFIYFFFVSTAAGDSGYCSWTVAALFLLICHFYRSCGSVNSIQDPQILLFCNFFIKNGFYSTIHILKNYFVTIFSILTKISSIQTDPNRNAEDRFPL